jgi:hypothetical protein
MRDGRSAIGGVIVAKEGPGCCGRLRLGGRRHAPNREERPKSAGACARLLSDGRAEAIPVCERATRLAADATPAWKELAIAYDAAARPADALAAIARAIRLDGSHAPYKISKG